MILDLFNKVSVGALIGPVYQIGALLIIMENCGIKTEFQTFISNWTHTSKVFFRTSMCVFPTLPVLGVGDTAYKLNLSIFLSDKCIMIYIHNTMK